MYVMALQNCGHIYNTHRTRGRVKEGAQFLSFSACLTLPPAVSLFSSSEGGVVSGCMQTHRECWKRTFEDFCNEIRNCFIKTQRLDEPFVY